MLLLGYLGLLLAGGMLVGQALIPTPARDWAALPLKLCVGLGLAVGCSACVLFALVWQFGGLSRGVVGAESLITLGFAAGVYWAWGRNAPRAAASAPPGVSKLLPAAAAVFAVCLAAAMFSFVHFSALFPHGAWDAWAGWNQKARFLYRGGDAWTGLFQFADWRRADYPLLLPLTVARAWMLAGSEATLLSRAVAFGFTFGNVALLTATVGLFRGWTQGLIAGSVLLSLTAYRNQGMWQYADVPLAFFFLLACVLVCAADYWPAARGRLLFAAGAAAGCAAWTKNEGLLFAAVLFFSYASVALLRARGKQSLLAAGTLLLGTLITLSAALSLKLLLAPSNQFSAAVLEGEGLKDRPFLHLGSETDQTTHWEKLSNRTRYRATFVGFGRSMWHVWGHFLYLVPLCGICFGIRYEPQRYSGMATTLAALFLMKLGYFMVFVATYPNLQQALGSTYFRLVVQVLPASLFLAFCAIASPDRAGNSALAGNHNSPLGSTNAQHGPSTQHARRH